MLPTLRRFPLLAALVALSLVLGPAASALCVHLAGGHEEHASLEMPMDMEEPTEAPCHESPAPETPPARDTPGGADCDAPCCVAAAEEAPLTVAPSVPPLVVAARVSLGMAWPATDATPTASATGPPPPPRLYLETGRIRV
ncbi:MAG: hypothetical protein Rubg2KO_33360 [Rubricoccaceae bacterium]